MSHGGGDAVPVRPASTVMLLRDGAGGVEVFTLQRVAQMAFAAGMTVFPGGGVDPSDAEGPLPWRGPDPDWWAAQWRIQADAARAQVVAAARELFEETGVLLASPADGQSEAHAQDRAAVTAHQLSLPAALSRRGQHLCADLLTPWARWITPPGSSRRYDTYFFLAALPQGQQADAHTSEAVHGGWHRPVELLRAGEEGEIGLMPPTLAMLTDLAEAASVSDLQSTPRDITPVMPEVLTADGEVLRVRVGGREYTSRRPPDLPDTGP